nr:hypothetical protein [Tanacetum cinerariifolium]
DLDTPPTDIGDDVRRAQNTGSRNLFTTT